MRQNKYVSLHLITMELTLLHSEKLKLYGVLAFLSAIGLKACYELYRWMTQWFYVHSTVFSHIGIMER